MSIFKRLKDVTAGGLNALLDKAENPVLMANQYIRDMEKDITKAENAVAKHLGLAKQYEKQANEEAANVAKRQQQAELAINAGNEDLARKALLSKSESQAKYEEFHTLFLQQKQESDRLLVALQEMKEQYKQLLAKKQTLEARHNSAKAMKQINQSVSGFGTTGTSKNFARMEQKVMELESHASATSELGSMREKTLDEEFKALGGSNSAVDAELEALKQRMGK